MIRKSFLDLIYNKNIRLLLILNMCIYYIVCLASLSKGSKAKWLPSNLKRDKYYIYLRLLSTDRVLSQTVMPRHLIIQP